MTLPIVDRPSLPFEHRQATAREDWGYLLGLRAVQAVVGTEFYFVWSALLADLPLLVRIIVAGLGIVALAYIEVSFWGFGDNPDFVCRIDEEALECISPIRGRGETFRVLLDDIVQLEGQQSDLSRRWSIHDRAGQRFWLTSNYGNPVDSFLAAIRELRPDVEERRKCD